MRAVRMSEKAFARAKRKKPPAKPAARPRAVKSKAAAPGPRESELIRDLLAYLKGQCGYVAWRCNSGAAVGSSGRRVALAPAGTADVLAILPTRCLCGGTGTLCGVLLAVEAKRPGGGRLRESQRLWLAAAAEAGAVCVVARSTADVYAALAAAGYDVPNPDARLL